MKQLLLIFALALAPLGMRAAATDSGVKLGLQTWTCRNLTFEQTVDFASAHGIKYLELYSKHLDPAAPQEETLRKKALLDQRGLVAYAFGVAATSLDKEANRKLFELARLMGIKLIIVEPKNPAEWDNLEELVREYDIKLAIHNHWRGSAYGDPAKVRELLAKRDPRIGVCLDLGWVTAAGFDAAAVFREYGDRVFDVHFKDKKAERSLVQTPISDTDLGAPADQPKTLIRTGVAVIEQLAWIDTEAGRGAVNFAGVFTEIKKSGWSGVMAIETDSTAFAADPHPLVAAGVEFFRSPAPPKIEARKKPTLTVDGKTFRDLNASGALDPYEDWRLPVEARVSDLIARLTVEEKAGLMLHAAVQGFTGPNGIVLDQGVAMAGRGVAAPTPPSAKELVVDRHIRWLLLRATVPAELAARAANAVQELAESTRLGVPVVLSSDPRHTPAPGTALPAFSAWPEQIGFAAIGDPAVAREFGRIANREYRAIGLRVVLGPMADVATEPRWSRIPGTFGEDAALVAQLTRAYIEGFQGETLGPDSVLCVTKHWPGHGPVQDGLDPHLDYGRWQVYPGKNFEHHLGPFRAAFDAGTGGIMPGYAIPVGLDTVGMNFSPVIVRDLLRGKFHFDGLVLTDWLKSMPWGVEKFSQKDRHRLIVEAGCDQIGGEDDPQHLVALMHEGALPASRIDASLRRILRPMFQLGLFENPYVDPAAAKSIAASAEFVRAGLRAQTQSVILLKNAAGLLPLAPNTKIYVENIDRTVAAAYGLVVADLAAADVALIKVAAPFALHRYPEGQKPEGFIAELFSKRLHEGTLAYAGAENTGELAAIERLVASGKPVVVCMYLDRPAILTEFLDEVGAVLVHFSSSDRALLDVAFGRAAPSGKLPFDLPRDMDSVRAQQSDVPHDLANPLFRSGFGLSYPAREP